MIEITRIKVLLNGSGKVGVLPVSIFVDDVDDFRKELRISLDWRQKDDTEITEDSQVSEKAN